MKRTDMNLTDCDASDHFSPYLNFQISIGFLTSYFNNIKDFQYMGISLNQQIHYRSHILCLSISFHYISLQIVT